MRSILIVVAIAGSTGCVRLTDFEHPQTASLVVDPAVETVPEAYRVGGGALGIAVGHAPAAEEYTLSLLYFGEAPIPEVRVITAEISAPRGVSLVSTGDFQLAERAEGSPPTAHVASVAFALIGGAAHRRVVESTGDMIVIVELFVEGEPRTLELVLQRSVRWLPWIYIT